MARDTAWGQINNYCTVTMFARGLSDPITTSYNCHIQTLMATHLQCTVHTVLNLMSHLHLIEGE